jgi:hypothetical protein
MPPETKVKRLDDLKDLTRHSTDCESDTPDDPRRVELNELIGEFVR